MKKIVSVIIFLFIGWGCGSPVIAEPPLIYNSALSDIGSTIYQNEVINMGSSVSNPVYVPVLKFKIYPINDWDMVADQQKDVVVDIPRVNVRTLNAMIINDTSTSFMDFNANNSGSGTHGIQASIDKIVLYRATGGDFDNISHDSTSFNRGYLTVGYVD